MLLQKYQIGESQYFSVYVIVQDGLYVKAAFCIFKIFFFVQLVIRSYTQSSIPMKRFVIANNWDNILK